MPKAVLDSTILVSAFLTPRGLSLELLRQARGGAFHLCLADEIIQETQQALLAYPHLRKHHRYSDEEVIEFCATLKGAAHLVTDLPPLRAVSRDPKDDPVIACAVKAQADYL